MADETTDSATPKKKFQAPKDLVEALGRIGISKIVATNRIKKLSNEAVAELESKLGDGVTNEFIAAFSKAERKALDPKGTVSQETGDKNKNPKTWLN